MRTFLELQDAILKRTGDQPDQDKMRDLVKETLNTAHRQVLTERRYAFMLWPQTETLEVEAGRKTYPLHPQLSQFWYGHNNESGDFLEEIPSSGLVEVGDNLVTGSSASPYRFLLTTSSNVKRQPSVAGPIVVTTTGGTEAASNKIFLKGIVAGAYVEEILSSGALWTTLTSAYNWTTVESITKIGTTWTRTISAKVGTEEILQLFPLEFGRQYRQMELTHSPSAAISFQYRFYRKPLKLVNDNDIPQIPESYDDILVYSGLIDLQGFSRPDPGELKSWINQRDTLLQQMQMNMQQTRSVNGRATYTNYAPR